MGRTDFSNLKKDGQAYIRSSRIDARAAKKDFEMSIRIRVATAEDVPVLRELIEASVRELQAEDYSVTQTVFGVDSQLIADGTYLVAEDCDVADTTGLGLSGAQALRPSGQTLRNAGQAGVSVLPRIAGCGGWSKRKTLYGGDRWTQREDSL
jgi:hypothetical protein